MIKFLFSVKNVPTGVGLEVIISYRTHGPPHQCKSEKISTTVTVHFQLDFFLGGGSVVPETNSYVCQSL